MTYFYSFFQKYPTIIKTDNVLFIGNKPLTGQSILNRALTDTISFLFWRFDDAKTQEKYNTFWYNYSQFVIQTIFKGKIVQKEPMLEATYRKLSEELEQLKSVERGVIAKVIDEARELGDLKENAEYHAAKDKQGLMEARIAELTDVVGRAQVVDPSTFGHDRVSFGSTVVLVDQDTDEEVRYTIVGGQESNPQTGLISIQSPMARVLIGKEEGDEVELSLPSGKKTYDIEEILYEEITLR